MAKAVTIPESIEVICEAPIPGTGESVIEVDCEDFDAFKKLPAAVMFQGRVYGCSGWNSDRNRAYFRTDKPVGVVYAADNHGVKRQPSGTGKSLLAKSVAGETGIPYICGECLEAECFCDNDKALRTPVR